MASRSANAVSYLVEAAVVLERRCTAHYQDGVTVAREIELEDKLREMGYRWCESRVRNQRDRWRWDETRSSAGSGDLRKEEGSSQPRHA